jgi:hypothetical protein
LAEFAVGGAEGEMQTAPLLSTDDEVSELSSIGGFVAKDHNVSVTDHQYLGNSGQDRTPQIDLIAPEGRCG